MPPATALELLRRYADLHDGGVANGDFRPMLALFADDAEMRFVGLPLPPSRGRAAIAEAFRRAPPDDSLLVVDAAVIEHGSAEAAYAWRAAPSIPTGPIRVEEAGGTIRRLTLLAR